MSNTKPASDFSIDAIHELAMFIRDEGKGEFLIEDSAFCAGDENENCATSFPDHFPDCGPEVDADKVFFAVKTCEKFHRSRVPVVQKTWGRDARNLVFYSETKDSSIPTESTGLANTERGHCGKMMVILKKFHEASKDGRYEWLIIADDDTLLSVPRLRSLLACYESSDPVALGERYGFSLMDNYGYDYITGGGGMVLNRLAVHLLVEGGLCSCGSDDAPDDMTLGMCLKRLAIPVTHSPLFHQARPDDYAEGLLKHQRPVSFHKHWMISPIPVYEQWFGRHVTKDEL